VPDPFVQMIWAVTGALVWEGVLRIMNPEPVDGRREHQAVVVLLLLCLFVHSRAPGQV
jgi:hypothetical protein